MQEDRDIKEARRLLMEDLDEGLESEDRISLTLVLYGEKPGASLTTETPLKLERFCELTGLAYRQIGESEIGMNYLVSGEEEDLEDFGSVGSFLGYPDSAVQFFNEYQGNRLNWKYIEFLDDLLDDGKLECEDVQYLYLVQYIPELSEEKVREAVDEGRDREESLLEKDRSSGLDIGSKILEQEVYSARNFVTQQKIDMLYLDFVMNYGSEELEDHFLDELEDKIFDEQCFDILMMLLGEKPGSLVMSPSPRQKKVLKDMCDELDLHFRVTGGGERSLLDRLLGRDTRTFKDGFFISREEKTLERLEASEGDFYGFSDKAVGEFLGYPKESTLFYHESDQPSAQETSEKISELENQGKIEEDEAEKLSFISYVPKPDELSIKRGIKIGNQRKKKLHEMDKDLETDLGEIYIRKMKKSDSELL